MSKTIQCRTVLEWLARTRVLASDNPVFSADDPSARSLGFVVGDDLLLLPIDRIKERRWGKSYKKVTWENLDLDVSIDEIYPLLKTPAGRLRLAEMLSKFSKFFVQLRDMVKMLETGAFNEDHPM